MRVRPVNRLVGEGIADARFPIGGTFDEEIVVVLVEGHNELVKEAFGPEHALERHLQRWILDERNMGLPGGFGIRDEREAHLFELDRPMTAQDANRSDVRARSSDPNADGICGTSVEERDRCTGVDQGAKGPVAGVAVFKSNIDSRS